MEIGARVARAARLSRVWRPCAVSSGRLTMAIPRRGTGWIWNWASPTVALGLAWDTTEFYVGDLTFHGNVVRVGTEMVVADVLSFRYGQVDNQLLNVDGATWGVGLAVQYQEAVGIRLDWAHYPVFEFLSTNPDRYGVTLSIDPHRLWRSFCRSATSCFSFRFSSRSLRSARGSGLPKSPNLLFQRLNVFWVTASSRQHEAQRSRSQSGPRAS